MYCLNSQVSQLKLVTVTMGLEACSLLETLHFQYPPVISQGASKKVSIKRDYPSQEYVFLSPRMSFIVCNHTKAPIHRERRKGSNNSKGNDNRLKIKTLEYISKPMP